MATNAVRGDGKGRHTTTHRELVVVPGKGILLDTQGMRAVGLWAQSAGLELAFSELELLAEGCRFRDCSHSSEPGCQVTAAIAAGSVSKDRLASWLRLQQEQLAVAARPAHPAGPRKPKQHGTESMRPNGRR